MTNFVEIHLKNDSSTAKLAIYVLLSYYFLRFAVFSKKCGSQATGIGRFSSQQDFNDF